MNDKQQLAAMGERMRVAGKIVDSGVCKNTSERCTPSRDTIRDVFMRNGFVIKDGHCDLKPYVYDAANELIAIYHATCNTSVPDGWRLVPIEPTIDMCNSGAVYDQKAQRDEFGPTFAGCYRAMLDAAPEYNP